MNIVLIVVDTSYIFCPPGAQNKVPWCGLLDSQSKAGAFNVVEVLRCEALPCKSGLGGDGQCVLTSFFTLLVMTSIFIHCVHYVCRYSGSVTAITLVWTCLPYSYLLQSCVDTRSCADCASLLVMNSVTLGMSQSGSIFIHECRECFCRIFTFLWIKIVTDQDRRHMTMVVMTPSISYRLRAFTEFY